MQLSIIIVNYNVRYFLEQCLYAVHKAIANLEAEVIVADNHSADDSLAYLQPLFPRVQFISNRENLGFAKANNLALLQARGEYILFLNPDTLVPEDCLELCLDFINQHPHAGALGVPMLDGKGRFLPESKRAFPSPLASFYKLTGLAALFPKSAIFNRYALGDLAADKNQEVDVLAGAFMLVRRQLLETLNGFDEAYFLYGEDIDLSYRIKQAGWQNHYFAGTRIIHFKGESADRNSLDHVKFFYSAMLVFVHKHYTTGVARGFSWFIRLAIGGRGALSAISRIIYPVLLPVIDGGLVLLSLQVIRMVWVNSVRHGLAFGVSFIPYAMPLFALVYISAAAVAGLYDKIYKTSRAILSVAFGVIMTLAVYSLLPEALRFSRGVIVWGGLLGGLLILWLRQTLFFRKLGYEQTQPGQTLVVGSETEYTTVAAILENAIREEDIPGRIEPGHDTKNAYAGLKDLAGIVQKININEIIFCEGVLRLSEIIDLIKPFSVGNTRVLFHMSGSRSIIGSDGPAATPKILGPFIYFRIAQPYQQRMKRLVDMIMSFFFLLTAPVHLVLHKNGSGLLRNAWQVLAGKRTWVGYASDAALLPHVKKGIITQVETVSHFNRTFWEKSDRIYAKNYDWWQDVLIVCRAYGRLA